MVETLDIDETADLSDRKALLQAREIYVHHHYKDIDKVLKEICHLSLVPSENEIDFNKEKLFKMISKKIKACSLEQAFIFSHMFSYKARR
jgi:hypothetical protein